MELLPQVWWAAVEKTPQGYVLDDSENMVVVRQAVGCSSGGILVGEVPVEAHGGSGREHCHYGA